MTAKNGIPDVHFPGDSGVHFGCLQTSTCHRAVGSRRDDHRLLPWKVPGKPWTSGRGESIRVWMGSMGCLLACRVLGFVFVLCFCCLVKHWTMLFFVRWSATQAIGKLNLLCLQRHCVTNFLALAAAPVWLHRASFALRFTLSLAGFVPSIRCTVRAE